MTELWKPSFKNENKHQLSHKWNIIIDKNEQSISSSTKTISILSTFDTVEEFWSNFNSMHSLKLIPKGIDVFIVKTNNETNKICKIQFTFFEEIKDIWDLIYERFLLLLIGSSIIHYLYIHGISYSIGHGLKITLLCSFNENSKMMLNEIMQFILNDFKSQFPNLKNSFQSIIFDNPSICQFLEMKN